MPVNCIIVMHLSLRSLKSATASACGDTSQHGFLKCGRRRPAAAQAWRENMRSVAMEGKEKRKKKTNKNRLHQRTCMENWRIHQVRFHSDLMLQELKCSSDLSPLGVRTPITVAHERLSCIFSPPSMVSHSVAASADTLIVLAWSMITAREIDLHSVGKEGLYKGRGGGTDYGRMW